MAKSKKSIVSKAYQAHKQHDKVIKRTPQVPGHPAVNRLNTKSKKQSRKDYDVVQQNINSIPRPASKLIQFVADVVRQAIRDDKHQRSVASFRTQILQSNLRQKAMAMAMVCRTLQYLPIIKILVEEVGMPSNYQQNCGVLVLVCESLFGKGQRTGQLEVYIAGKQDDLKQSLQQIINLNNVNSVEELLPLSVRGDVQETEKLKSIRVNTLISTPEVALQVLKGSSEKHAIQEIQEHSFLPDVYLVPSTARLFDHPAVRDMQVVIQSWPSCIPAVLLEPQKGDHIIDACSAPGNKTCHVAALLRGKGHVLACERDRNRYDILRDTVRRLGAQNIVQVAHCDFLALNHEDQQYKKVARVLVDPSCSGSGIANRRLDHLLPSNNRPFIKTTKNQDIQCNKAVIDGQEHSEQLVDRLRRLSAFQIKILKHALAFPAVRCVVYSTCSVHYQENEHVVASVLPFARDLGYDLQHILPSWHRRGMTNGELPAREASKVVRVDPAQDGADGFFVARFGRQIPQK